MATSMAISARPAATVQPMLATGGFMQPRIVLAPAGPRILEGVRLVAVPRRAVVHGMANAGDESMAEEDMVYRFIEVQGLTARSLLKEIEPLPHLVENMETLKSKVAGVVSSAQSRKPEKMERAEDMIRLAYNIIDLAYKCCPVTSQLPKEDTFVDLCFGRDLEDDEEMRLAHMLFGQDMLRHSFDELWPGVSKTDRKLMKAVMVATNFAIHATARYVFLSYDGTLP